MPKYIDFFAKFRNLFGSEKTNFDVFNINNKI